MSKLRLIKPDAPDRGLKALVLDWAGTAVDFGSLAPVRTLARVFEGAGVAIDDAEARRDMGIAKKEHIARILSIPRVNEAWHRTTGRLPTPADVDRLYTVFVPLQCACLLEYAALIPGVAECVERCRRRGLKIGSTTGYSRAMLDLLIERTAREGYHPDCSLSPEDVGAGRPLPLMLYEIATRLRVAPLSSIAKVGDTPADIEEGLNAGTWAIGVAGTGNGVGMSLEAFRALGVDEQQACLVRAHAELERAGAHYVVDSVAELDPVLDEIDARLRAGERPTERIRVRQ